MKFVVFALLALAVVQGAVVPKAGLRNGTKYPPINRSGKIFNGIQASYGQFPHMVAIFIDSSMVCGGSLVSPRWILTAAHCVKGHSDFINYLGSLNLDVDETGRLVETSHTAISHENYTEASHLNDIGLIQLSSEVTISPYIRYISLPSRTDVGNTYVGAQLTISGWGGTSDISTQFGPWLRYATLTVISNAVCESTYGPLPATALCTSGQYANICDGDEGDPLVDYYNNVQIGVASHGSSSSCQDGSPAVYSRLTTYLEWISTNTGIPIP